MYQDTITLFNRHGSMWYATVIGNVDLNVDKASIIAKYGESNKDNAKLHIKYFCDGENMIVGGKHYLTPKVYASQDTEQAENTITFRSGNDFDFFIMGAWDGDSVIFDNDFTDGFYNHLNKKYDGVYAISSVGCYSVIPHFEILAK